VADADETRWQHVKKESTDELGCLDGQEAAPIATPAIAIGKGYAAAIEIYEPFVANSTLCV
jgi:hypothetical protein